MGLLRCAIAAVVNPSRFRIKVVLHTIIIMLHQSIDCYLRVMECYVIPTRVRFRWKGRFHVPHFSLTGTIKCRISQESRFRFKLTWTMYNFDFSVSFSFKISLFSIFDVHFIVNN